MATAPATPINRKREMVEVKAPAQFQFTDQHRTLSGILIDIDQVMIKPKDGKSEAKPTMQYVMQHEDGDRSQFLGTYDLTRKIQPAHIGYFMTITYEGEDSTVQTQGSPLRKFRVQVSKEKEAGF